jgi:hypothetical protein
MLNAGWAIVRNGQIELLEKTDLQEGARLLVTFLPDEEMEFWLKACQPALDSIWENEENDVYAELLKA